MLGRDYDSAMSLASAHCADAVHSSYGDKKYTHNFSPYLEVFTLNNVHDLLSEIFFSTLYYQLRKVVVITPRHHIPSDMVNTFVTTPCSGNLH